MRLDAPETPPEQSQTMTRKLRNTLSSRTFCALAAATSKQLLMQQW